jgi:acyl carrier protein
VTADPASIQKTKSLIKALIMIDLNPLYRELEDILELEPASIKGDELLQDLNWDSMTLVMFLAMADEHYSVQLPTQPLAEAKTVADLAALIEAAQ